MNRSSPVKAGWADGSRAARADGHAASETRDGPALGPGVQVGHRRGRRATTPDAREDRGCLVGLQRELGRPDLEQVARGAQAGERQPRSCARGHHHAPGLGEPVDDVGEHVEAAGAGDRVDVVEQERARSVARRRAATRPATVTTPRSGPIGAAERSVSSADGVVVDLRAGVPRGRARPAVGPLREHRRLAVARPGDERDHPGGRDVDGVEQAVRGDQPRPRCGRGPVRAPSARRVVDSCSTADESGPNGTFPHAGPRYRPESAPSINPLGSARTRSVSRVAAPRSMCGTSSVSSPQAIRRGASCDSTVAAWSRSK